MRILICNYEYPPLGGGGGVVSADLARELARRHQVTVLTSQVATYPLETVQDGVRVLRVPVHFRHQQAVATFGSMLTFLPAALHAGRRLLERERFDIINTHFVLPTGPVGNALATSAGIPNVLTVHGGDLYDPSKLMSPHRHPLLRRWVRYLLRRADAVVVSSRNMLDTMRRFYGPELSGIRIPYGIPPPPAATSPPLARLYAVTPEDVLLVTVSRLVRRKAAHQLVDLMQAFRAGQVRLLIVGDGPEEARLREHVVRQQLQAHVFLLGRVDERTKFQVLRESDVYASTAQHEGFGLTFVEAMASGLPVVCYDHGGQTDFLADQETGFVVPLNDLARFTDRCRELIDDPRLRRTLGSANELRARDYLIDRCAARYEAEFARLTCAPRTPAHVEARSA